MMSLYVMRLNDEFGEPYYDQFSPDFIKVAEDYINSAEAQHGDAELARYEAMEWWELFVQAASTEDTE